jgi:hypothetical protein
VVLALSNKKIMKLLRIIPLFALSLSILSVGCQTKTVPSIKEVSYASPMGSEPVVVQTISVPGKSEQEVKRAITRAAIGREWDVQELGDGRIQAKLVHRTHDSTLWFSYSSGTITISSLSYEINKTTQERKERS